MQLNQDDLQRRLIRTNITRYRGLIASEPHDAPRTLLANLLAHERRALQTADALEGRGAKAPQNSIPPKCPRVDEFQQLATQTNISALLAKLAAEPNMPKRAILSRSLFEEVNEFADRIKYWDGLDSCIAKCDAQIAKHSALLDCGVFPGIDQVLVERVLKDLSAIRATLRLAGQVTSSELNILQEP